MKPKYLLNSYTQKLYSDSYNNDHSMWIPLVTLKTRNVEKADKYVEDYLIQDKNTSCKDVSLVNKAWKYNRSYGNVKSMTGAQMYLNTRHYESWSKISKWQNVKFENEMKSLRDKPEINRISNEIVLKSRENNQRREIGMERRVFDYSNINMNSNKNGLFSIVNRSLDKSNHKRMLSRSDDIACWSEFANSLGKGKR